MESPSYTKEEQKLLTPHEYTREALSVRYQDCVSCRHRTEFTCIKCGYCYSCHWKKEKEERRLLDDKFADIFSSPTYNAIKKEPVEKVLEQQPSQGNGEQQLIIDVHGRTSEPICNYHGCDHNFSVHGLGRCKCKHPTNKTLGVFTKYS